MLYEQQIITIISIKVEEERENREESSRIALAEEKGTGEGNICGIAEWSIKKMNQSEIELQV